MAPVVWRVASSAAAICPVCAYSAALLAVLLVSFRRVPQTITEGRLRSRMTMSRTF